MKIKGMGPKTIEKLGISSIPELYELSIDDIQDAVGDKVGTKLYDEIERSKIKDFPTFLAAFSIPLIGTTAAFKLGAIISDIGSITPDTMKEAGLGDKARANLWEWIEQIWYIEKYREIPVTQISHVSESEETPNVLSGTSCVSVVITGKLNDFKNRTEAQDHLKSLGFQVRGSVNKTTDYLIDEEGRHSSSRTKAESLGIKILTINELTNLYTTKTIKESK